MTTKFTRAIPRERTNVEKYIHAFNILELKTCDKLSNTSYIKAQYKNLALKYHADHNLPGSATHEVANHAFVEMKDAKELLLFKTIEIDMLNKIADVNDRVEFLKTIICNGNAIKHIPNQEQVHKIFRYFDNPSIFDVSTYKSEPYDAIYLPDAVKKINAAVNKMHPGYDFNTVSDPIEQDKHAEFASTIGKTLDFFN